MKLFAYILAAMLLPLFLSACCNTFTHCDGGGQDNPKGVQRG